MSSPHLLHLIRQSYTLPWHGTHGVVHWARVLENGLRIAAENSANVDVIRLFAVFHDSRRVNEGNDPGHGLRGAQFAQALRGTAFDLPDPEFALLYKACAEHTDGKTHGDITVQTCWDADRLDLGRVGIRPHRNYLCTDAAKDETTIQWAFARGMSDHVPESVLNDWGQALES